MSKKKKRSTPAAAPAEPAKAEHTQPEEPAVSSTVQHTGREGKTRLRNQEAVRQMQAASASITHTMSFNRKESPIATTIQVEGTSSWCGREGLTRMPAPPLTS